MTQIGLIYTDKEIYYDFKEDQCNQRAKKNKKHTDGTGY
jgi:hypothetical protein